MKIVHVGAAALNLIPKDWAGNTRIILEAIAAAKERGVAFLCLPELCLTGYGCEDEFHAPYVPAKALEILFEKIAPATTGIAVGVGLPFSLDGCVYNGIAHVADGRIVGFVAKQNLAGDGIHYEPRFFKAWPAEFSTVARFGGLDIPVGDLIFEHDGVRIGYEVCEDAWVAARPGIALARNSIDLILNPSASHFAFGKSAIRERFVREGSRAYHCAYVYANLLGNEAGRSIYDGDCLIANSGHIAARGERFHYGDATLIDARIDLDIGRVQRRRQASFRSSPADNIQTIHDQWLPPSINAGATPLEDEATHRLTKEEEFAEAVALGLYDYMRKSHSRGFTLSLSGGADSATCLALVYYMATKLVTLKPDNLPNWIAEIFDDVGASVESTNGDRVSALARDLTARLCTCAYQATVNSGSATREAARSIAEASGARFQLIDVQPLVEHYESILADFLDRELSWEKDDIARQNIQARCRAPGIWAIANATGTLLISTSNRSEAAVGYCTMDGDTAGSLSPIAGIDKAFLLQWLRWAEGNILPALSAVNALEPTAELRPSAAVQTDEADLMPYPILNRIQKLAVVQKASPKEIFHSLQAEYGKTYDGRTLFDWLAKYLRLWSRNQWKRERYAPSFHLDDENLDPRSWCRYPILSGAYEDELEALSAQLFPKK